MVAINQLVNGREYILNLGMGSPRFIRCINNQWEEGYVVFKALDKPQEPFLIVPRHSIEMPTWKNGDYIPAIPKVTYRIHLVKAGNRLITYTDDNLPSDQALQTLNLSVVGSTNLTIDDPFYVPESPEEEAEDDVEQI